MSTKSKEGAWEAFTSLFADINPIVNFAGTILIAVYVIYTAKTFKQIRRQTDLQMRGFLVCSPAWCPELPDHCRPPTPLAAEFSEKWTGIAAPALGGIANPTRYCVLKLKNRGRSDIHRWQITVDAAVKPSDFLRQKFQTAAERKTWTINSHGESDHLAPDEELSVAIVKGESFPTARITWKVNYTDVRGGSYTEFGGEEFISTQNPLLHPRTASHNSTPSYIETATKE